MIGRQSSAEADEGRDIGLSDSERRPGTADIGGEFRNKAVPKSVRLKKGSEADYGSPSVFLRSFAVLDYVVRAGRAVLPSEIASHIGLPKPTVYRMIEQLEERGFIQRQFMSRRFSVGTRLTELAFDILYSSVQYAPRRQILSKLVEEVGETCNIGALDGGNIVYFERVEAEHWSLQLNFHVGSRVPLHCTAIGKLFLAFLPAPKRAILMDQLELGPFTANTLTTVKALDAELDQIRREGLAVDREEFIAGVVCLAAPIFNDRHEITAGIAIQTPSARMPISDAYRHRVALQKAARAISESYSRFNRASNGDVKP
ncbi:IclR family transcriptional regulator [Acidiphilium acidophilum]|uniref:IclR family transcriptional regulator n=1 Tax=Acidiphilium acidophilum TaxID=76588 RepID=UPI002E8E721A|nr:IclR family transcriptional regulator [Acidiphilium acidophilum]